jgi:proton-dependent oligopeptide transporter, POT family
MAIGKTFFGHPRGLATLFFTEMWERFSYYGMRALLYLFMIASVENGGLALDGKTTGAIYGLYTMFVYLLALPGGWIADKFLGLRKSVFYGGCVIALGHFCMAIPGTETFFMGLFFIVIGTGLLKPNISSLVGSLYPMNEQARRDSGFSIFYMGINIGATIAPLITGYLGEQINWHYGFGVAGIGMVLGLIQYKATEKYLGDAGNPPEANTPEQQRNARRIRTGLLVIIGLLAILVTLLLTRTVVINPVAFAQASGYVIITCVTLYFIYIFLFEKLDQDEKKKILAIAIFFVATTIFYGAYEQAGSSLNFFAKTYTDLFVGSFEIPASWFQSVTAVCVLIFVPVFAWLWVWLAKRNLNPSTPVKLAFGLFFMGLGFAIMMGASIVVANGDKPLPTWLIFTYMFHTFGEICLYPIGLSAVTKLSPQRLVGQMMGVYFMALALGNLVAGLFAGEFDEQAIASDPSLLMDLFGVVTKVTLIAGVIVLILNKPIRKLMGSIR